MAKKLSTLVNIQAAIEQTAENFRAEIQKSSNFAWRNVSFKALEPEAPTGAQQAPRVANNENNRAVVSQAFDVFFRSIATQTTQKRIDDITNMFTPITTGVQTYYTNEIAPPPIDTINTASAETGLARTNWLSFAGSIRGQVLNPVLAELQGLLGTTTKTEFTNRAEYIIKNRLVTYLAPAAHASMQNHYRAMSSLYGTNLQLVWILYVRETSSAERRPFCVAHESGLGSNRTHYHVNEIKRNWPQWQQPGYNGKNNWAGAIPGTGADNILINGGGYNCLHSFRFVKASEVSQKDRNAARANGAVIPF